MKSVGGCSRCCLAGSVVGLIAAQEGPRPNCCPRHPGAFADFLKERDPELAALYVAAQRAARALCHVADKTTGLIRMAAKKKTPPSARSRESKMQVRSARSRTEGFREFAAGRCS
jgi:hypothetical protein